MAKKRVLFKAAARGWQSPGWVMLNSTKDPIRDLERIAGLYAGVAHDRVESLRTTQPNLRGGYEFEAYPTTFLYRHALELILKAILHAGAVALADAGKSPPSKYVLMKEHALRPLFAECCRVFKQAFGAELDDVWDFGVAGMRTHADLAAIVAEFDEFDAGSYTFRYSITTDGAASLSRGFEFDLYELADTMDTVISKMSGMPEWIRGRMQDRWKAAYEAQQEAWENASPADYVRAESSDEE
jgi:hypothetical protein